MTIPTINRVNGEPTSQRGVDYDVPAEPSKPMHPIRQLARLHHVCAVAVAEEYKVPMHFALDKMGGTVTSIYIEACRRGFTVTGDVQLPTLSQE